jgi:uncharacterized membrane protein (DUF485 family)
VSAGVVQIVMSCVVTGVVMWCSSPSFGRWGR